MSKGKGNEGPAPRQQKLALSWNDGTPAAGPVESLSSDAPPPEDETPVGEVPAATADEGAGEAPRVPESPTPRVADDAPPSPAPVSQDAAPEISPFEETVHVPATAAGPADPDGAESAGLPQEPSPAPVRNVEVVVPASAAAQDDNGGSEEEAQSDDAEVKVVRLPPESLTVGQTLVEARGNANLTVAQVSQKIRVPKTVIENLEMDRYSDLPSAFYCRSYLRKLCEVYGLDPERILTQFSEESKGKVLSSDTDRFRVTSRVSESGSRVTYTLEGQVPEQTPARALAVTRILVSVLLVSLAVLAAVAVVMHQLNKPDPTPDLTVAPGEVVELHELITPQQLPLDALPIPER